MRPKAVQRLFNELAIPLVAAASQSVTALAQAPPPLRPPFVVNVVAVGGAIIPPRLDSSIDRIGLDYDDADTLRGAPVALRTGHASYLIVSSLRECGNAGCPVVLLDDYRGRVSVIGTFLGSRVRALRERVGGWPVLDVDGRRIVMIRGRYAASP